MRVPTVIRLLNENAVKYTFRMEDYVAIFERRVLVDELEEDSIRNSAVRDQLQKAIHKG